MRGTYVLVSLAELLLVVARQLVLDGVDLVDDDLDSIGIVDHDVFRFLK